MPDKRLLPNSLLRSVLILIGVWAVGCSEVPQIVRQRVPKPPRPSAEDRMLAAIVPAEDRGWFLKLSGKRGAVAAEETNFKELLESLKVEDGVLKWDTPDGWREEAGSGMRAATFRIGDSGSKLECTVISLPAENPRSDAYLLSNINRWRGQLGLGNISAADLNQVNDTGGIRRLTLGDGTPVTWVSLDGNLSSGGQMPFGDGAPFADAPFADRRPTTSDTDKGVQGPALPPGPAELAKPSESKTDEFTYTTPQGWKPGRTGEFRKVAFEVEAGGKAVEITVSSLAAAGSGLLPNVNRWRRQIALEPVDQSTLDQSLEQVTVDGRNGHVVELIGARESILGAVVLAGDQGWFFKLKGDRELAAREKQNFLDFVKSVKFRSGD